MKTTIDKAPACLNMNDKAMWVTGWNDSVDALKREEAQTVELAPSHFGMTIKVDETAPAGEVRLVQNGNTIGKITNAAYPAVKKPPPTEREALSDWARHFANTEFSAHSVEAKKLHRISEMLASDAQAEHFCYCNGDVSLQSVSGDGAPDGYLGKVTLRIGDQYRDYCTHPGDVAQQAAVPQVERVPMTDDEIYGAYDAIESGRMGAWFLRFARAIEAHHGIGVKP